MQYFCDAYTKLAVRFILSGNGTTVSFLKALIFLSGLASVVQIIFQIILGSLAPYGHFLERCKHIRRRFRQRNQMPYSSASAIFDCSRYRSNCF